ncbi:autotransporter outer membrane beta-barrel domain-containing protein [Polynucleobacter paneuropaeus]|nr:autotransporter outer membrane beta-barrel domain-containing protein [Polynucleobacter paneuropaeus]
MSKNTNFHTYRNFLISFGFILTACLISLDANANCASGTVTAAEGACNTSSTTFSITSTGSVIGGYPVLGNPVNGLNIFSSSGTITNYGTIAGTNGSVNFNAAGTVNFINESTGIIYGNYPVSLNQNIRSFTNNGQIYVDGQNAYGGAIYVGGNVTNGIFNTGTITVDGSSPNNSSDINQTAAKIIGDMASIQVDSATITGGITNSGTMTNINPGHGSYGILNSGSIDFITNTGTITAGNFGISNNGTITTLNNAQGGNSPLTYTGALPTSYNIIINSPTSFGKLAVTSGTGSTAFGIYTGSSVLNNTKYAAVLSGITSSQITNKSGTYGGYSWALGLESGSSDTWDLLFGAYTAPGTGPSVANTNQSLANTASALQGTYTLQNSVLANSFSYDCNVFGANNVCVSAGGRNTQVQAANGLNNTSALLIAAYRPHPNYRIGAYADQNLSVSNPGGTVNLGNNTPLIGLFGAWNERLDGTGTEVKVSAAYGQKNTTINRSVVGSGATASEAGSGSSTLNSQGAQATVKYGFSVLPEVIVSPYVGVRYTQNNMGGYTESTSSSVTAPLTYNALNTNATTALAGVGASYRVIPAVMTFASAGVESDTNTANGTYSATNASIGTLTPVNFNANPVKTRPTATVGAYYDVAKNQRLGVTGIYRQEAYQAVSTTTVMATYTIGL